MAEPEMPSSWGRLRKSKGQAITEYALIIAFIAIVAVAALTAMGASVSGFFSGSPGWF
jgi:Flp pilus assembly pilin Flp